MYVHKLKWLNIMLLFVLKCVSFYCDWSCVTKPNTKESTHSSELMLVCKWHGFFFLFSFFNLCLDTYLEHIYRVVEIKDLVLVSLHFMAVTCSFHLEVRPAQL